MIAQLSCPDLDVLRHLVGSDVADGDQKALVEHIDTCASCQRSLEDLAADAEWWSATARNLGTQEPGIPDAVRAVIEGSESFTGASGNGASEIALDFLEPSDNPGSLGRLDHYESMEVIGKGGMGIVLKALDTHLQRIVAVKVMLPHLASCGSARQRFVREARAAAAICHDHVVTIHAVDETKEFPYLVMQYVAGISLQEKLDRCGALELKQILRIGIQVARGLHAAHTQGLLHGDVKPANILLENGVERAKLTDFGLARTIDGASLSQSGVVAGTPQYMAPEQARAEAIDHRADLFSLGSVLYAMCTGSPPFRAETTVALLKQVSEGTPRPIRETNAEIPTWLVEVIEHLHAKNPADRFSSASEVAAVLQQSLARLQRSNLAAPAPLPPVGSNSPPPAHETRHRYWLLAAAVVLLLSVLSVTEISGVTGLVDAAATVLRIRSPEGTLVVEIDDPQIRVTIDGRDVVITGSGPQEIRLRAGEHRLQASRGEVPLQNEIFTITRGGKQVVRVRGDEAAKSLAGGRDLAGPAEILRPPQPSSTSFKIQRPTEGKVFERPVAEWGVPQRPSCGMFSPDGKTLATGLWDGSAVLWDMTSGRTRATLRTGADSMRAIAVSPDGKTVATGTADGTIRLWNLESGELRQELSGQNSPVLGLAFSPDGATLASCGGRWSRGGFLSLWDVKTGRRNVLVPAFEKQAWSVAYAADGKSVAVAVGYTDYGRALLVSTASGKTVETYVAPSYVRRVAFSPDGKKLAVGYGEDGMVKILDASSFAEVATFQANLKPLFTLVYIPDGRQLLTSGVDGTTVLWDVSGPKVRRVATFLGDHGTTFVAAMSQDGRTLTTGGWDGVVRIWDVSKLLPPGKDTAPPGR